MLLLYVAWVATYAKITLRNGARINRENLWERAAKRTALPLKNRLRRGEATPAAGRLRRAYAIFESKA
jgi:hypothetical protein